MMQKSEQDMIGILKQRDPEASRVLADIIFGDDLKKRDKWFKLLEDPVFHSRMKFGSLDEERDLAFKRLKKIADAKMFSIFDFEDDPVNLFTCHEMLGTVDGSVATKFTVQNNLFGGTLMALSTA